MIMYLYRSALIPTLFLTFMLFVPQLALSGSDYQVMIYKNEFSQSNYEITLKIMEAILNKRIGIEDDLIEPLLNVDAKISLLQILNDIDLNIHGIINDAPFPVIWRFRIEPIQVSNIGDISTVHCRFSFIANNLFYEDTISVELTGIDSIAVIHDIGTLSNSLALFHDKLFDDKSSIIDMKTILSPNSLIANKYNNDFNISNNLLVPEAILKTNYGDIPRFTSYVSSRVWNRDVIGRPFAVMPFVLDYDEGIHEELLFISDFNWHRIFGIRQYWYLIFNDYQFITFGEYGQGEYQFVEPSGIAFSPPYFITVADAKNKRAMLYNYDNSNGNITFIDSLANQFGNIADVASAFIKGTSGDPNSVEVALLDSQNGQVHIFKRDSQNNIEYSHSIFSNGNGINQLNIPSSLCYGKDFWTHDNTNYLYVADKGNNRIVRQRTDDPSDNNFITTDFDFGDDAVISSVTVGSLGFVYAVDRIGCIVHKFNKDLEYIASFGSKGILDDQFTYPERLNAVNGLTYYDNDTVAASFCGLWVTEELTELTGIRHYAQGFDILGHTLYFYANSGSHGLGAFSMYVDPTSVTNNFCSVYYKGTRLKVDTTIGYPLDPYFWEFEYDIETPQNGYYVFEMLCKSTCYSDNIPCFETTVKDSVYVAYPQPPMSVRADSCSDNLGLGPQINIYWNDVDPACANNYDIYRDDEIIGSVPGNQNSWTDRTVVYGTTYAYKIRSRWDDRFYSAFSMEVTQTPSGFPPAAPSNFCVDSLNSNGCNVIFNWHDNSNNEETFYIQVTFFDHADYFHRDHLWIDSNATTSTYHPPYDRLSLNCELYAIDMANCVTYDPGDGIPPHVCGFNYLLCSDPPAITSYTTSNCRSIGCPFLYVKTNNEYAIENNLLGVSSTNTKSGEDYIEYHNVSITPVSDSGLYKFLIIEASLDTSYFDQIELYAVDKSIEDELVLDNYLNAYAIIDTLKPIKAIDWRGHDVTNLILARDRESYYSDSPGYIDIYFAGFGLSSSKDIPGGPSGDPPIKEDDPLPMGEKISLEDKTPEPSRLNVYIWNDNDWELIDSLFGLAYQHEQFYSPASGLYIKSDTLKMRFQWNKFYRVDQISYLRTENSISPPFNIPIYEARLSNGTNIRSVLRNSDDNKVLLRPDDTISLSFDHQVLQNSTDYKFIFKIEGQYVVVDKTKDALISKSNDGGQAIPKVFEFAPNYPNPFNPSTTFKFALPFESHVTLDIYNILGQKVATVINKSYESGIHILTWDSENIGSGVYFARFSAGDFAATRKVVILK